MKTIKPLHFLIGSLALLQTSALWADCPDMSQSSVTPPGWYMIRQGTPLLQNNQFNGATWNLIFSEEIVCTYNSQFPFSNAFQLVSLQALPKPTGGVWQIVRQRGQQGASCPSDQITACPFTYSN